VRSLLGLLVLVAATPASAAVFELSASLRVGAVTGSGLGGAQKDADFFAGARGSAWGAALGLEVFWLALTVEHTQLADLDEVRGTWTQVMVGPHFMFPLDRVYADLGVSVGYGVGTGQQIVPPLDDGEVSDKGLVLQLRVGLEYRLNRFLGVGVMVPLGWGYLVKNDLPVTETEGHYTSFHAMVLGTMTARFGF
jgi:hypothetical protein